MIATMMGFLEAGNFIYTPNGIGVLFGLDSEITPLPLGYFDLFVQNIIFIPLCYGLAFMTIKLMKPEKEINGKSFFQSELNAMDKITKDEKKIIIILLCLIIFLFTTSLHGLDMLYGFIVASFIMYFPGFNIGTKEDVINVNFGTLMFVTACMSIGSVASAIGIGPVFSDMVLPFLENANEFVFIGLTWVITMLGLLLCLVIS